MSDEPNPPYQLSDADRKAIEELQSKMAKTPNILALHEYARANRLHYFETTGTKDCLRFLLGEDVTFGIAVATDVHPVEYCVSLYPFRGVMKKEWDRIRMSRRMTFIVGALVGILVANALRYLMGY